MSRSYNAAEVEAEAQSLWAQERLFEVTEDPEREKYYCLAMFPYPSGALHMGHLRNYTLGDVLARYHRMKGFNVLQPMGWDAFGLPAENAAIKHGVPPAQWTRDNIAAMRSQLQRMGLAYDWTRELATCDPDYYRWEQWLFTQLLEKGLVYKKKATVNWCPNDQTVLANEQVVDGGCWRCDTPVVQRDIAQWFLKITDYADELLADLDRLTGWPEQVVTMQRNWIGRSEGVEITFQVVESEQLCRVFTTRPDTLFGVTYLAVAPQHPIAELAAAGDTDLAAAIDACKVGSVAQATIATMDKKGVDTGLHARHPITGEVLPIYVANFVLMGYGEGAVMSVPAHDQRDYEFAQQYGLPIKPVVVPTGFEGDPQSLIAEAAFTDKGVLVDSAAFSGLSSEAAFSSLAEELERQELGQRRVNYRLRDWGVSRQRYWGTPIPMIHCEDCGDVPVPESDLPVVLPEAVSVDGGGSPLAQLPEFYQTVCPRCGTPARRETDTFDTFFESSWYFARFACPDQDGAMLDQRADYWLPVDQYVGGIEHAILHLLYARFFTKLMRDVGLTTVDEPFERLLTQGMVLKDGAKMSKSRGNTVDPQKIVERYGADTARLFIIFSSPPEQSLEWNEDGVAGAHRFLKRLWALGQELVAAGPCGGDPTAAEGPYATLRQTLHQELSQASHDYGKQQFNTVVSAGMKMLNALGQAPMAQSDRGALQRQAVVREGFELLLKLLAPIVPHVTDRLWRELGYNGAIMLEPLPQPDPAALERSEVELIVQINGKLRAKVVLPTGCDEESARAAALAEPNIRRFVGDGVVRRVIYVPGRLINIVV